MKKIIIPILIGVIILSLGAIIYDQYDKKSREFNTKYYTELSYSQFKEMVDNKETFVLLVHQTGCEHCETYMPVYRSVADEHELQVYGINRSNFSNSESKAFAEILTISGTPTTVFFQDGEELTTTNRLVGSKSRNTLINQLKSLKYLNEDVSSGS